MWAAHGQPTCSVFRIVKNKPGLCELDQNRPYVVCLNCCNEWLGMCGNK